MKQRLSVNQAKQHRSTPGVFDYRPQEIQWQDKLVDDIFEHYDYSLGTHAIVCSGTVGSGKSLPAAHIIVRMCLEYPNNVVLIDRKALPDLKDTIYKKIKEHLQCEELVEGKDYECSDTRAEITFRNGSQIISRSWADKNFKKLGSLEISCAVIEEAAENDGDFEQAYDYILSRCGRLPHIPFQFCMLVTNPDDPEHWIHTRLISKQSETVHVYYSSIKDNPFLPESYEQGLRANMDPKLAKRLLDGLWVSIRGESLYHQYVQEQNHVDKRYEINPRREVVLSWDFNIAEGKPLSAAAIQFDNGKMHVFNEVVIEGMRTQESCEEMIDKGIVKPGIRYRITGDAAGRHRDTRNKQSDYDIIEDYFSNVTIDGKRINFIMDVPMSNPALRFRHNSVNAWCNNAAKVRRLFTYKDADTCRKGLLLTKLKPGGSYIEDDSKSYQHVTTAIGYALCNYLIDTGDESIGVLQR